MGSRVKTEAWFFNLLVHTSKLLIRVCVVLGRGTDVGGSES